MSTTKIFNTPRIFGSLLVCGIMSFAGSAYAQNTAPVFAGGSTLNVNACMNQGALAINSLLSVTDPDAGQTETWSVVSGPANGTLAGFSTSVTSTGSTIAPTGLSYTPATSFTGNDTFIVNVSDGIDNTNAMVVVRVRPLPSLSSTLAPAAVCDQSVFSYMPSSFTSGATFAWHRNFAGGISTPLSSGTGSISESLTNITYYTVPVTYVYTTSANGCSTTQSITVDVHPTPRLSSPLYDTTCNGANYSYVPTTSTAGTSYLWSRAGVTGISPATASGTGSINETLTSSLSSPVTVVYNFILTANGCTSTRNVNVYVVPQAPLTSITTSSPGTVCAGTMYQSFWAGITPPAGISYTWSATNADIFATGTNGQYILVNFPTPGDATVTLHINGGGAGCAANSTYAVSVGAPGSAAAGIIWYNYQLVYLDNLADTYQWGYDMSGSLSSVTISGANFQSYPISSPDFTNRHYWVMTTKNGCMQKTYYNSPVSVAAVNQGGQVMNVYPNPAGSTLNVDVMAGGTTELMLSNMMGQVIKTKTFTGSSIQLDMNDVPAGSYFVSCYQHGARVGTSRFVKN